MAVTETVLHIRRDGNGVAWVDDTNVKVVEVVRSKQAYDLTPEELHEQYPHLSLAQIYSALAYYYDHREELEAEIERRAKLAEEMRQRTADQPLQARLRAAKKTWTP
jgi:uncharacterized protein (DUF433 family)